jgi:acyl-coenzyme A thioesterase PaaI-like protein
MLSLEHLNQIGVGKLPGHLGILITHVGESEIRGELEINESVMAPNGFLLEGTIVGSAKPVHLGKTTQVWDTTVTRKETGKTIVLFRCTQLILYGK